MASRDLTAAFIERRAASNLRRRTGDNVGGSIMKPFGMLKFTLIFAAAPSNDFPSRS